MLPFVIEGPVIRRIGFNERPSGLVARVHERIEALASGQSVICPGRHGLHPSG
ncbi:hypothetical protein [Burkholderia sp. TSV86]|uniref:hypothetical protein n=1 Tax=Burkholderia sp. TSV86 TaxID=1385594 RepID=UPI000A964981|nr:hypothetical protein [Burkholderia sp. TSV86]